MILDQRSEIEEFFLESLDSVKEEIRKKTTQEATKKSSRFPDILTKSKSEARSKVYSDKIDFGSLGWEDKEKILRILFSKMNAGVTPTNWRNQYATMTNNQQERSIDQGATNTDYNIHPYMNADN